MIISFDGNVYTGKTTIIKKTHSLLEGTIIVPEYYNDTSYLDTHSYLEGQMFFLSQEKNRIPTSSQYNFFLLDRSFLSIIGHSYAIEKMNRIHQLPNIISVVKKMILSKEIRLPDYFFFLKDELAISYDIDNKGTTELYFSAEYRDIINNFIYTANSYLKCSKIISAYDAQIVQRTLNHAEFSSNYGSILHFLDSLI